MIVQIMVDAMMVVVSVIKDTEVLTVVKDMLYTGKYYLMEQYYVTQVGLVQLVMKSHVYLNVLITVFVSMENVIVMNSLPDLIVIYPPVQVIVTEMVFV